MPPKSHCLAAFLLASTSAAPALAVPPDGSVTDGAALEASSLDASALTDDVSVAAVAADASVVDDAAVVVVADAPPVTETPPAPVDAPVDPTLDVANYTLEARLDPRKHEVTGTGTITWRNTSQAAVRELWFHLYLNGFANERTLFMRTSSGEHRGNERGRFGRIDLRRLQLATGEDLLVGSSDDPAVPDDRSQLHVTLPREVRPGESIEIRMEWLSVLPEVFARTGYHDSFHMVAQWFPKVAVLERDGTWGHFPFHGNTEFYADFGRYDVTLVVPPRWTVGATGEPSGAVEQRDGVDRHHFVATRVHDFAWTAWDHFRERRGTAGETALRVLYPPGEERGAAAVVVGLERLLPAYAHRYGEYPYPGLTVVIPPRGAEGAGGMEYPTLITSESFWWMNEPALPATLRFVDYVTFHEFGHQYFYGLVASSEWSHPMLDEGFTEYATCAGLEDLYGNGGPFFEAPSLGVRLESFAFEAANSAEIKHVYAVARGASEFPSFGSYAGHVYPRTATVLRTAEFMCGRERFRQAMRAYAERWRFRHPTPEDFFTVMRENLGDEPVERLLRPALTRPMRLDYSVQLVEDRTVGSTHFGRAVIHREGTLELPVHVVLERADGVRQTVTWDGRGEMFEVPYEGSVALRAARVDPEGRVPLDANRINNARVVAGESVASSAGLLSRTAYWVGLLLQAVGP
jgi:hypothetical protein